MAERGLAREGFEFGGLPAGVRREVWSVFAALAAEMAGPVYAPGVSPAVLALLLTARDLVLGVVVAQRMVHCHGGPLAGRDMAVAADCVCFVPSPAGVVVELFDYAQPGAYVRDESSPGGRCFDWQDSAEGLL